VHQFNEENMKKILIILTATLFITLTAKGQNLFFFGEESYPCTETFTLQSNSNSDDVNVVIAKDGKTALFIVSTKPSRESLIRGKLIIYLDDGTVVTCDDREKYDYVDNIASSVYYLTNEQLSKMKNSNINTVRYSLNSRYDITDENFSASNKDRSTIIGSRGKTDVPALITEFFY
jgi:hypothetical protein